MTAFRIVVALCLAATAAQADENSDLDKIPGAVTAAPPADATTAAPAGKIFIEDAVTAASLRPLVVPQAGRPPPRWINRTSIDARWQFDLGRDVTVTFSDRFNLFENGATAFGEGRTASNDLREAYLAWEPAPRTYVEAGRINLREGVALGFNPTDFFRARTLLDEATADPSALRDNRLGTVMLRAQHLFDGGAVSLAYAPKLADPGRIGAGGFAPLDPLIDRTNGSERILATVRADIAGLAPEALIFRDGSHTRLGFSASTTLGKQIVAYGEWAGGMQAPLIAEAIGFGARTGSLPAGVPVLPSSGTGQRWRNALAVGFSWTGEAKVTINVEYHLNEAGFSRRDWRDWFALGRSSPSLAGLMWYERAYAADQQVPVARQQFFIRVAWSDAFARDLDITALGFINPDDGSALTQLSAVYNLNRGWTAGLYLVGNSGAPRSEHGSAKTAASLTAQVQHFF